MSVIGRDQGAPDKIAVQVHDGKIVNARPTLSSLKESETVYVRADLHRGAVSFTDEELHCLTCAMAGNFPDRFKPIRMDLLRKLAKATRHMRGQ